MLTLSISRPALVVAAAVLLSACQGPANSALSTAHAASSPSAVQSGGAARARSRLKPAMSPAAAGWAPADLQARYKLPSSTKGSGQIVAIVDAYDNPNVASDLATYRSNYDLGTANFTKYNQQGKTGNYPQGNTGWGIQIDLDVEMVSASCPLCTIYLIEANSADGSDLAASVREAVKLGVHIVNTSWGCAGSDAACQRKTSALRESSISPPRAARAVSVRLQLRHRRCDRRYDALQERFAI